MDDMLLDMFICIYAVCSAGYICDYKSLADKYNSDRHIIYSERCPDRFCFD